MATTADGRTHQGLETWGAVPSRHLPAVAPLTARSVVLSTLLGHSPSGLPVHSLVRVGGLFGMTEKTVRVALARMVADGDLAVAGGVYRLTERLREQQSLQDESLFPLVEPWSGTWEMALVTAPTRPLADRVALRRSMVALRLAEVREGVWARPANLGRKPAGPVLEQCTFFDSWPEDDPLALVHSLWDLEGWAHEARRLIGELGDNPDLVDGFSTIAEAVRHLLLDPVLPAELLRDNWPGGELRARYRAFKAAYTECLRASS